MGEMRDGKNCRKILDGKGYDGRCQEMMEMKGRVLAVQRMQDYIDGHLSEEITLADLARASFYSPWYSYRLFKQWVGMTPADYIRRLRLSKSAFRLRDFDCRIVDVAFELGFGNVDGYQWAFYREFGCNPREYTSNPVPLYLFTPYSVKFREIRKKSKTMGNVNNVFVQVIQKPARKVIVKRGVNATGYFGYCEEAGHDVWGSLISMKSISGEPVCLWLPERYRKAGTSEYVQGVGVPADYDGAVPEGFDVIELPAAEYLMFQGGPFGEEDYCQAIDAVQEVVKKYQPSVIRYQWDEENPRVQPEPIGMRGYIEMVAVKR